MLRVRVKMFGVRVNKALLLEWSELCLLFDPRIFHEKLHRACRVTTYEKPAISAGDIHKVGSKLWFLL
jgi:hypothetical protein